MAPETVTHVVVLDITDRDQGWRCRVDRWDPRGAGGELVRVSWNAERSQSPGYVAAAGGVVWVAAPLGYEHSRYLARTRASSDPMRICWTEGLPSGASLMMVALMPRAHALAEMRDGPKPDEAKRFDDRMAVFWPIPDPGRVRVCWTLEECDSALLEGRCAQINEDGPGMLDLLEDLGDATVAQRRQWDASRLPPSGHPPLESTAQRDFWEPLP